ncbi:MAG: sugar kinase, ribokinase [Microbacteriaceae bacterium]|nr:sugar kinase, ribokinase [Microbacteriaceae bacterium]
MSTAPAEVDVLGIGEAMVLLEPAASGGLESAAAVTMTVAGAELNACAAVTALGGSSAFLTRLGDDPLSDRVMAGARALGVTVLAERAPGEQAGVFFKQHETGETRSVHYYRATSAAARMDPSLLGVASGVRARVLLLSGLTAALGDGAARLLVAAADAPIAPRLAIDANLRPRLGHLDRSIATVLALLPRTWLLSLGRDEGELLFGSDDPADIAAAALRLGCEEVVVKDAANGSHWLDDSGRTRHEPALAVEAVDTVGAGDAFTGSYVWGRLNGYDRRDSARLASRVAARVVATRGDTEGLPGPGDRPLLLAGLRREGARVA